MVIMIDIMRVYICDKYTKKRVKHPLKDEALNPSHDPAIFCDPKTRSFETLEGQGIPLGVEESWVYTENKKGDLSKGQIIVLTTDGFWEAQNAAGEMFGKDRIYDLIRANFALSAKGILNI